MNNQNLRLILFAKIICFSLIFGVCAIDLCAQHLGKSKQIAITIDDLPLNGPQFNIKRVQSMTDKLVSGIKKYKIPTVGFLNESLLYLPNEADLRIAILKQWSDGGIELGNHTFSHLSFTNATLSEYEDDFIKGEAFTRILMKQKGQTPRYFRHPYLEMAATEETEKSFEIFIGARGYKIVPITIDTMDWIFVAAYGKAKKDGDAAMERKVSDEYLRFVALKIDADENAAIKVFGRPIKHILLSHANELNADNFDALIKVFQDKGYEFITVEEALKDDIYKSPKKYVPTSDWLKRWAAEKNVKIDSPAPPEYIQKAFHGN